MMSSRSALLTAAQKAESEFRWTDAYESMKKLVNEFLPKSTDDKNEEKSPSSSSSSSSSSSLSPLPTSAERSLFEAAAVKALEERRLRWDKLQMVVDDGGLDVDATVKSMEELAAAAKAVESLANEIIILLDARLIRIAEVTESVEDLIFYTKTKAEFLRRCIEFKLTETTNVLASSDQQQQQQSVQQRAIGILLQKARDTYGLACGLAHDALSPAHPLRLRLALSVGVFLHRVVNGGCTSVGADLAFETLNSAFQEGTAALQEDEDIIEDAELFHEAGAALKELTKYMGELAGEEELVGKMEEVGAGGDGEEEEKQ